MITRALPLALCLAPLLAACSKAPPEQQATTVSVTMIPGHGGLPEDTTTKEAPRLMLAEAYMRSYLQLFGGLSPVAAQVAARGKDGSQLFDSWDNYLLTLGFPAYTLDIPRQNAPNAVMVASFERVGIALCDRALENDWLGATPPPASKRLIFTFDQPAATATAPLTQAAFTAGFDVLHRTFLGYPSALAPTDRLTRFYGLYNDIVAAHTTKTRFTPQQAGWAAICYGLVRHPEFHLY
jgi:hypothetical protein